MYEVNQLVQDITSQPKHESGWNKAEKKDKRKPSIAKQHCDMAIVRRDEDYHISTIVKERPLGAHRGGGNDIYDKENAPCCNIVLQKNTWDFNCRKHKHQSFFMAEEPV